MSWLTHKLSREYLERAITPWASSGATLEVGAYGAPSYGRHFPNRVGIDVRPGPGVDRVASVYELPFADGEFENVLCMSVLEHLEEPSLGIAEMRRVLKPRGHIIVSVPFLFPIHDAPGDYWRFTKYGLRRLFNEGWRIRTLGAEADTERSYAILMQRLGYQTTLRWNSISKFLLFLSAHILASMPRMVKRVFGDIHKSVVEPDAFASAFFLVAEKTDEHAKI